MADTITKPRKRNDAYTGLLAISFLMFTGGTVLLYMDLEQYKEGENLKKAPDPIKFEVPGTQMRIVPGSGTPPPPKKDPDPMMPDPMMPDPMMPPPMMMMKGPSKTDTPALLPALETVDASQPKTVEVVPAVMQVQALDTPVRPEDPVVRIPDPELPPPPAPVAQSEPRTVVPVTMPTLTDEPPVAPKRFVPPM